MYRSNNKNQNDQWVKMIPIQILIFTLIYCYDTFWEFFNNEFCSKIRHQKTYHFLVHFQYSDVV